jgi:peptidylprolyl isomerase
MRTALLLALFLSACATGAAPPPPPAGPVLSMAELLEQSPASDWRALDPENTLYLDLAAGRIIIELAPDYAPNHVTNIKALAREHFFDAAAIIRAQDNYVVQWGRPEEAPPHTLVHAQASLVAEFDRARAASLPFTPLRDPDTYAPEVGFSNGFPVARDSEKTWMTHCYGMVGAGRDVGADSGGGGDLYVVLGQSPRNLDRNVTLVGRVVQGMELLSVMRRGTGPLGFYETPVERTPIESIRVAADVPAAERINLEALRTDSATFAALIENRRSRREEWFKYSVDRIGVCNVPLPVRPAQ